MAEALVRSHRRHRPSRNRLVFHLEELVADPIICHGQILANPQENREYRIERRANQPFGVIGGF